MANTKVWREDGVNNEQNTYRREINRTRTEALENITWILLINIKNRLQCKSYSQPEVNDTNIIYFYFYFYLYDDYDDNDFYDY